MKEKQDTKVSYRIYPIGYIRRKEKTIKLEILEPYRPALKELDKFSHVQVLWWANKHDNEKSRSIMQCELPYAPGTIAGVFACRAEYRANPIALTTSEISAIDESKGIIKITDIDAYDNSPILDLKGYIPVCDRVKDVRVPPWFADWPEWLPDEGLGL